MKVYVVSYRKQKSIDENNWEDLGISEKSEHFVVFAESEREAEETADRILKNDYLLLNGTAYRKIRKDIFEIGGFSITSLQFDDGSHFHMFYDKNGEIIR